MWLSAILSEEDFLKVALLWTSGQFSRPIKGIFQSTVSIWMVASCRQAIMSVAALLGSEIWFCDLHTVTLIWSSIWCMLLVAMTFSYNPGNMTGILYNPYGNRLGKGIISAVTHVSYLTSSERMKMLFLFKHSTGDKQGFFQKWRQLFQFPWNICYLPYRKYI